MAKWKTQWQNIEGSSKFHQQVRDIFTSSIPFKYMHCYQEVLVQELFPEYPHRSHRYDWYVQELGLVLELHGAQHYKPTDFSGQLGYIDKLIDYNLSMNRDNAKKAIAIANEYSNIAIPYSKRSKLSGNYIISLLGDK